MSFVEKHKTLISPIRRLPFEILQLIFIHSLNWEYDSTNLGSYRRRLISSLPFNVSQVCVRWREIALDTPRLWSELWTVNLSSLDTSKPRYLHFLNEILLRSKAAPLYLHIVGIGNDISDTHPAIQLLMPLSMWWEGIVLHLPGSAISSIFSCVKGRLASLRSVEIPSWNSDDGSQITVDVFEEAPRLQDIALFGTPSTRFPLPLHQVVNFHAEQSSTAK